MTKSNPKAKGDRALTGNAGTLTVQIRAGKVETQLPDTDLPIAEHIVRALLEYNISNADVSVTPWPKKASELSKPLRVLLTRLREGARGAATPANARVQIQVRVAREGAQPPSPIGSGMRELMPNPARTIFKDKRPRVVEDMQALVRQVVESSSKGYLDRSLTRLAAHGDISLVKGERQPPTQLHESTRRDLREASPSDLAQDLSMVRIVQIIIERSAIDDASQGSQSEAVVTALLQQVLPVEAAKLALRGSLRFEDPDRAQALAAILEQAIRDAQDDSVNDKHSFCAAVNMLVTALGYRIRILDGPKKGRFATLAVLPGGSGNGVIQLQLIGPGGNTGFQKRQFVLEASE